MTYGNTIKIGRGQSAFIEKPFTDVERELLAEGMTKIEILNVRKLTKKLIGEPESLVEALLQNPDFAGDLVKMFPYLEK